MLSINTNTSSLIAQRSLFNSTQLLNQAIERMTIGYKINHARDNSANYSIATNMSTELSSYKIAEDNACMGLDLLSTANDSLSLIADHFTRVRDLAVQAGNGTYGNQSLKAINAEVNARLDEIERLYNTTEYNGIKLFNADSSDGTFPGGNVVSSNFISEIIERDTRTMTAMSTVDPTKTLSQGTYSISTAEDLAKLATITNNGLLEAGSEFVLSDDIDLSGYSNWTPIGTEANSFTGNFDGNGYVISNLEINRPDEDMVGLFGLYAGGYIKNVGLENVNIKGQSGCGALCGACVSNNSITNCYTLGTIVSSIGNVGGLIGGVLALMTYDETLIVNDCYSSCAVQGGDAVGGLIGLGTTKITIANSFATGNISGDSYVGGICGMANSTISKSYITGSVIGNSNVNDIANEGDWFGEACKVILNDCHAFYSGVPDGYAKAGSVVYKFNSDSGNDMEIKDSTKFLQIGINSNENSQIKIDTTFGLTNISMLRNIGKNTNSSQYLSTIDAILSTISAKETEYGTCQNRLESALSEISTHYENLTSSYSTLKDADIAKVSSQYIRQQILQQASATLLSTANQSPSIALQLL